MHITEWCPERVQVQVKPSSNTNFSINMAQLISDRNVSNPCLGFTNPYAQGDDDNFLLVNERPSLVEDVGEPATFCVRCRTLSNTSAVSSYEAEVRNAARQRSGSGSISRKTSQDYNNANGSGPLLNNAYPPQSRLVVNSDGSDVPLLSNVSYFIRH